MIQPHRQAGYKVQRICLGVNKSGLWGNNTVSPAGEQVCEGLGAGLSSEGVMSARPQVGVIMCGVGSGCTPSNVGTEKKRGRGPPACLYGTKGEGSMRGGGAEWGTGGGRVGGTRAEWWGMGAGGSQNQSVCPVSACNRLRGGGAGREPVPTTGNVQRAGRTSPGIREEQTHANSVRGLCVCAV